MWWEPSGSHLFLISKKKQNKSTGDLSIPRLLAAVPSRGSGNPRGDSGLSARDRKCGHLTSDRDGWFSNLLGSRTLATLVRWLAESCQRLKREGVNAFLLEKLVQILQ